MSNSDFINTLDCPYYLIYRVSLLGTSALKNGFIASGIENVKPAYLGTLMTLWLEEQKNSKKKITKEKTGLKLIELGKRAGLEPSTMTGLIDRMERDGLVIRTNDPDDRRAQIICLTDTGKKLQNKVEKVVTDTLDNLFNGISDKEIEQTKNILMRILINANRGNNIK